MHILSYLNIYIFTLSGMEVVYVTFNPHERRVYMSLDAFGCAERAWNKTTHVRLYRRRWGNQCPLLLVQHGRRVYVWFLHRM